MSATSSGSDNRDDAGAMSSSTKETLTGHAKGAMQGGGAEGGPSSSQHKLRYDPSKYATKQHEESIDIGVEKNHQEPSRQTGEKVDVKSIHGKTRSTPNPEAGKPPLPQSPKIPAETNRKDARAARREQNARDKPSSSQHNQANDPTDPSKCTTDPDVEIPFTDSEENRQGPPEQSTPQTKDGISLHGKTSRAPNPKAGDSHFSKSCSSTESSSQTGKQDTTAIHLNSSLSAASSSRVSSAPTSQIDMDFKKNAKGVKTESLRSSTAGSSKRPSSEDPDNLYIQWNTEPKTEGNKNFEIHVLCNHSSKTITNIQIVCKPADFYRLKFLFDKKSKDLMNNLSAMGYTVYIRDQEIFLENGTVKNPELIRNDIEAAIIRMKDFSRIVVHSAATSFADERLVDKCEVLSSEFKEGNIAMYLDHLSVWIVGRDGDKLKVLETKLMEERLLLKENIIDLTETLYFTEDHQGMKNENTVHLDNPSGMPFVESHFASDTELSQKEDTKEVRKHNYFFVVEAETRVKDEERELQVECSPTEYLKLLFIFSNETLKMKAKEKFRSFKIILCEKYSMRLEKTCMCMKPKGRTKLDGLFIDDALSACKSLFPLVHIKKMVMDPSTCIEEIKTYCFSGHDACKETKLQLFQKIGSDKVWMAIEHEILDFGNEVIKDLISNNLATECPLEQKNHKLIAYFVQSAVLKDKDLRLFNLLNMLKKNKYLADKYEGMNVSEKEKWVIISGHKEIHEDLFEKMMTQSGSVPPSLNELLNNHEVLEFIFQNFQAKHPNEPMCWMVAEQSGKSFLEAYALKSSAINVFETILHCFKEIKFEYACLQKDAFLLPDLKGDKFRGKIGIMDTENFVKITGTVDVFEEYIDLLQKESDRLKKPVCKTIDMNSINILRFCETYHQDSFRKWKKIVDIKPIVRDGKCCYTIKGSPKHQGIVEEIENELQKLLTSIVVKEVVSKEEMINMDLSRNQELRKKRCEIEREWSVDTVFESVPGQDWSVEDGFEWHFQNGQSFTILTLKSALPVETDVVLHPCPMANIKVGTHQTDTDDYSNRDWHCLKFEVEHKDVGKAKDTLRESLKTTLLTKVKGTHFQNIVFPLDQKTMERIGWSITHYLKQILYAVHEGCRSEPWSIYFLCAIKDEFEACVKILKTHFEDSNSSMSSLKIKTFPIQENLTPAITIEIKQGSLVETEADVIVNTTDKSLRRLQNGQISKSILFAAGDELSKECVKKYSKGVGYSEVAVTPSFQLKLCKKIYHGGIPTYNGTLEPLKKFVWNCLLQATKDKMKTIAFPAIGTGNLMYPIESVAEAMMSTVEKFRDEQSTTLISVFFVIFDTGTLQKFRERNSSKQAASGTETPSVRITVIGSSDGAENASLCLREFINDLKKKENVNVTKPAELMQQPTPEGNKGQGKSKEIVDDQRRTILSKTIHKRENISDDRISLGLILVKKALDTDSSLDVEECRRHFSEFKYKNIICPFGKRCQALIKFETKEDTDRVLKNFKSASFKIEKLPHQAVNNIKAKLSREIVNYLKASDFQEEEVENETGAHLDKNEWIITGTLLEIKQAEEFLRMKICKNAESKGQNSNTCLPKGIPDASAVDASAKKTLRCSIWDWEAVKFFFKDVISKFYSKPDLYDSWYVVSGNQEAINEFSHSLKSLFKRTLTNIGQDNLKLDTKSKSVYYYLAKKESRLIMYAKSEKEFKAVEELFKSKARKGERGPDEVLDEENQNLPQKTYPSTTDNNDALNDEDYEMEADDFNTVCHFYKELTTDFRESYDGSKVHLKGPKDQVENLKFALQEITQKFHTVEIERDGREQSKIYDIYAQMMQVEHSVHTRVIIRGSKIAVLFTGKERKSVADLKSWFEVELKNKTKTSGKKIATYQKKSSLYENCLIFEEKRIKVYAIEKEILEVSSAAIVCPYPLHVGQYIREKLGVESGIADYISRLSLGEIKVIPVDTSSSKLTLLHTSVPSWTKYYQKDNPSDDCIQDIQSIVEKCLSAGEIYKTLSIPVFYSDDLCQLPNMIWCTAVERALRNYSKIRKGSNEINIYMVDKKPEIIQTLKRFFMEGISWSFVSNETFSVFYFGSTFQVHVKKADIFGAEADALAVPQDPGMKNERFIAKRLSKLEDKSYQSAIKSLKLCKPPTVTMAPSQLCFTKVIHYVSPNWNNRNKSREALLQDHYLSMKTLLDAASCHCASVVIPLSGGQNTTEETRKEIAKSTAAAVADWFKENSKKLNILKTIYFENDDTKSIRMLIECFERKLKTSCFVMRPQLSSVV